MLSHRRKWMIPATLLGLILVMSSLGAVVLGSGWDIEQVENEGSKAILPVVMQPQPTPFTPPVSVHRYRMEYGIETAVPYLWMPEPRYWDGNGVRKLSILEISPAPTDRFREKNGTGVIYWENPSEITQTYKIIFDTEIGFLDYGIDEDTEWPPYDTQSDLYRNNIMATSAVQVDHPEIQAQAAAIVGSEQNPYKKAKLIHQWMIDKIGYGWNREPVDALSVLRIGYSHCGGRAHLFVALCRASGIPTRNVAGMHMPDSPVFESGNWPDRTMWFHVWAEFYLPEYGWIQVDPGRQSMFGRMYEPRLPTSKGNEIELGHGWLGDAAWWFHIPTTTWTQLERNPLWLDVTTLP